MRGLTDHDGELFPGHISGVHRGDVKIAVLNEREWVSGSCQLGVASGGSDDSSRGFLLQQGDDELMVFGIVKGEILRHQLLARQISVKQQDFATAVLSLEFLHGRGSTQGSGDVASQRKWAGKNREIRGSYPARGSQSPPVQAPEHRCFDLVPQVFQHSCREGGGFLVSGTAHSPCRQAHAEVIQEKPGFFGR